MARAALRIALGMVTLLAAVYLADLVGLHFNHNPTGIVSIRSYYAVPRNDKREELMFNDPEDETCVNTLFPHQQMPPCWYLRRHTQQRISL
jgi:hypothetical protein